MSRDISASSEADEAWAAADEYELRWLRAREGARAACKGVQRANARYERERLISDDLRLELTAERALRQRAENEVRSLRNKVERLSLRIIEMWGRLDAGQ